MPDVAEITYSDDLLGNPSLVLELLAVVAKRAGGELRFSPDDTLPPYNLAATLLEDEEGKTYLKLRLIEEPFGHA